jgi:hypothetical protein
VIPRRAGSLDSGPGEALLAHELTHVAQRSRLGSLPPESTRAGQLLEGEATAVEMTLATGASPGPSPLGPPGGGTGRSSGAPGTVPAAAPALALPLVTPTPSAPDTDALAATILEKMSALSTPGAMSGSTEVYTSPWSPSPAPVAIGPVQRAPESTASIDGPPAPAAAPLEDGSMARPSDEDLSNLSRWLYPLIKYRLKGELREDRERTGLLTNHYGRW